ncbi:MAG: transpeptidase family protein [Bacteroidetes bacterium]|nr:transpeptidase family protein [Bacteroidota bacterium]MBS1973847.1 transpeptidase family protein [Bacteroidota bacterium]
MEIKRDILWRVYLCFLGIGLLCLIVLGKAFYIQHIQGSYWRGLSDSLHLKQVQLEADRGTIYSDNGDMLSTSIPFFNIYIDFGADGLREKNGKRFKENLDSLSFCLANLFKDQKAAVYKRELLKGYKENDRYYELQKNISFEQYKALRKFPLVRLGRNKSGFIAEVVNKRLNSFGLLANRTIGLARSNAQNVGLERTYDTALKGENGSRLVRYMAAGIYAPVDGSEIDPVNGKDIVTTLDVNIQDITENALLRSMAENEAEHGTCIVMEVGTGKIKAIANLGRQNDGTYWEDYNYALNATEPGSTIKLATLLSVLSEGKMKLNDLVDVGSTGKAFVGVRMVTDAERQPKSILTVKECFEHSSNVGMSKIAYETFASNPEKFLSYLHKFHLDEKTGIDLMGEGRPVLPKFRRNTEGLHAMVTMSFGYAIQVTPLQTLMLYNAVANNGKMLKPYLVDRIQNFGQTVKEFQPQVLEDRIADDNIIKAAQDCMHAVTTDGTGRKAFKGTLYPVAGKTGTAHVAGRDNNGGKFGYDARIYQASFVGYFPFDKPQYSCIVVIRTKAHPKFHMGGEVAAPVFREIADKLYALSPDNNLKLADAGIKKDGSGFYYAGSSKGIKMVMNALEVSYVDSSASNSWARLYASNDQPVLNKEIINKQLMPDVKGMGLKDALYVLEQMNLRVAANGVGKVKAQSVQPGVAIAKNQIVKIELN